MFAFILLTQQPLFYNNLNLYENFKSLGLAGKMKTELQTILKIVKSTYKYADQQPLPVGEINKGNINVNY